MGRPICKGCVHSDMCSRDCNAISALFQLKREVQKEITKETSQALRATLDTKDCEMAEDLVELAKSVIDEHREELDFIEDMEIQIGFVRSYKRYIKDGRIIFADTEKTKYKYTAFLPFDFIITFYEPNVAMFNDEQKRILMWHELRHIGFGDKGYKVIPHEIEDFRSIIDTVGLDWATGDDW